MEIDVESRPDIRMPGKKINQELEKRGILLKNVPNLSWDAEHSYGRLPKYVYELSVCTDGLEMINDSGQRYHITPESEQGEGSGKYNIRGGFIAFINDQGKKFCTPYNPGIINELELALYKKDNISVPIENATQIIDENIQEKFNNIIMVRELEQKNLNCLLEDVLFYDKCEMTDIIDKNHVLETIYEKDKNDKLTYEKVQDIISPYPIREDIDADNEIPEYIDYSYEKAKEYTQEGKDYIVSSKEYREVVSNIRLDLYKLKNLNEEQYEFIYNKLIDKGFIKEEWFSKNNKESKLRTIYLFTTRYTVFIHRYRKSKSKIW